MADHAAIASQVADVLMIHLRENDIEKSPPMTGTSRHKLHVFGREANRRHEPNDIHRTPRRLAHTQQLLRTATSVISLKIGLDLQPAARELAKGAGYPRIRCHAILGPAAFANEICIEHATPGASGREEQDGLKDGGLSTTVRPDDMQSTGRHVALEPLVDSKLLELKMFQYDPLGLAMAWFGDASCRQ